MPQQTLAGGMLYTTQLTLCLVMPHFAMTLPRFVPPPSERSFFLRPFLSLRPCLSIAKKYLGGTLDLGAWDG